MDRRVVVLAACEGVRERGSELGVIAPRGLGGQEDVLLEQVVAALAHPLARLLAGGTCLLGARRDAEERSVAFQRPEALDVAGEALHGGGSGGTKAADLPLEESLRIDLRVAARDHGIQLLAAGSIFFVWTIRARRPSERDCLERSKRGQGSKSGGALERILESHPGIQQLCWSSETESD